MRTRTQSDSRNFILLVVYVQSTLILNGEARQDEACMPQSTSEGTALLSVKFAAVSKSSGRLGRDVAKHQKKPQFAQISNSSGKSEGRSHRSNVAATKQPGGGGGGGGKGTKGGKAKAGKEKKNEKGKKKEKDANVGMEMKTLTLLFWGIMPTVLISFLIFELVHRRCAGIDLSKSVDTEPTGEQGGSMRLDRFLTGIWPLVRNFFYEGPARVLAQVLLATMMALAVFEIFLDWCQNSWNRNFWDSMQQKKIGQFWASMVLFWQISTVKILVGTYASYIATMLSIRWRADMTNDFQRRWLLGRAFCAAHFPPTVDGAAAADNPDQRLQEDTDIFISSFLSISSRFVLSVGRLIVFLPMLAMLSPTYAFGHIYMPGWLVYISIIYSFLGSLVAHLVGQRLIPLNFVKQRCEADFRHAAVQVRDHAESIALYGAEQAEDRRLSERFNIIQRVVWEQMKYSKYLNFFSSFYFQIGVVFPFCILAPNYFGGQISLGQLMQILSALDHVKESLDWFVQSYSDITSLRATVDRLQGFSKAVDAGCKRAADDTIAVDSSAAGSIASALIARDVQVTVEGESGTTNEDGSWPGRLLWKDAGLEVQPAERVLLAGPDGCGKSLFLRALSGCWPARGTVSIGAGGVLFLPQKPFVPEGSLHAAVAYPETPETYSDTEIREVLKEVSLSALEEVSLQEVADWQRRLSGGELQRLAIAHALLRKAGLLVLDEATSAVGEDDAGKLYATLAEKLPQTAIVSVGHDTVGKVAEAHNKVYTYDKNECRWEPLVHV